MARTTRGIKPSEITADSLTVDGIHYDIMSRMTPDDRDVAGAMLTAKSERRNGVAAQIWLRACGRSYTILEFTDGTYSPVY